MKWEVDKEVIQSQLYALSPKSSIVKEWKNLAFMITAFHILNTTNKESDRRKLLEDIQNILQITLWDENMKALVKRGTAG